MSSVSTSFADYDYMCGYVKPSTTDTDSWSVLTNAVGTNAATIIKVGLFGQDLSCLNSLCAANQDNDGYCSVMTALGLDGWSMGIHQTKMAADSIPTVTIVQHQENGGDVLLVATIAALTS